MAKLYDSTNGVINSSFRTLSNINSDRWSLSNLAFDQIIDVAALLDENEHFEFFIYRLNLFEVDSIKEFIKTNQSNLEKLHTFDDGDIVGFQRSFSKILSYTHHALLTGYLKFHLTFPNF